MKQTLLSLLLLLLPVVASADAGGTCGDNLTWTFESSTGTLTISGSGAMRNYSLSLNAPWYYNNSKIKQAVIDERVTSIGNYAFKYCSRLTNIIIPDGVTSINIGTFDGCSSLTNITIPSGVTSIGRDAFRGCIGMTSITIPAGVTTIGDYAFEGCSGLTSITIPDGVTSIGDNVFDSCSGLTSITIPNSVTSIGRDAFRGCSGLTSITIPAGVTMIGGGAFSGCNALTNITIPDGVTSISEGAFSGCSELKSITIPNGVTSIGWYAFQNCSGLTSITIPDRVTSIGDFAFNGCSGLTRITIPDCVTSIGVNAFENCTNLDVHISSLIPWLNPDIYKIIFYFNVFLNNVKIQEITRADVPNGITTIRDNAFNGFTYLSTATIPDGVTSIGSSAFSRCSGLTSITIPDGVTSIGSSAFSGCNGLTSITIPDGVTSINNGAFSGCSGLTSINIPESVTSIGDYAFSGCSGLTSITIPARVNSICNGVFKDCSSLININLSDMVASIGNEAFRGCSSMINVTLPNSVTSIGYEAFRGCSGLTSINIPDEVTSIGYSAFQYCSRLTTVNISDLRAWCNISFADETANPLYYARHLYLNSEEIKELVIPNGVTTIGAYTFRNGSGFTSLRLPESVTIIPESVFTGCSGLTSITLPSQLKMIRANAFNWCSSLTSLTIPASVEYIYQNAFANCTALEQVNVQATTPPFLYDNSFSEYTIPVKVPIGCIEAYQIAQGWKNFTTITDANNYKLTYLVDNEVYKSYETKEGASIISEAAPTKEGYSFSGWSEIPETMPAKDVTVTGTFIVNKYLISYIVDGDTLKTDSVSYGASLIAEAIPEKEGYTFGGWSEIPETMPAKDVIVRGSFTVNTYKLVYIVDDQEYKTYDIDYGTAIIKDEEPTKEGHTFSGWSEIPETMPAKDIKVTGTFTANKYTLTYMVNGTEFKSMAVGYGTEITPEKLPTKEGYTFSGWNDMPKTMPAKDVTVTGAFTINKYTLSYQIDGIDYKTIEVEYGAAITSEAEPVKEGYTFSGWSEIPETMPAKDVTIKGSFTANKYTLTYQVNGVKYKTAEVEYGTAITSEAEPTKEGYTFSGWSEIPETMPAKEVTINGTFTINTYKLTYMIDNEVYKVVEYNYGAFITSEPQPEGDYVTFLWNDVPETMPAKDVTVYADYQTGIDDVLLARGIKYIYSPNGKRIEKLQKGLNIVVMNDGSVKKVVKK